MTAPSARVSLRDAAHELGVHYQTAYRWVRQGVLPAVKVGGSYEVTSEAIANLLADRAIPAPPPAQRKVRDWAPYADRLHRALLSGDEAAVRDLVEDLVTGGLRLAEICDRVIVPGLIAIGDAWSRGKLSVAEEHRASSICERAIARWSLPPPGRPRGVAVVCSAQSDEHKLPGEMATAVLRENRWQVHHLGIGVPAEDVAHMVEDVDADLVVVSVAWPPARPEAEALADLVRGGHRRVLVGASGMTLCDLVDMTTV